MKLTYSVMTIENRLFGLFYWSWQLLIIVVVTLCYDRATFQRFRANEIYNKCYRFIKRKIVKCWCTIFCLFSFRYSFSDVFCLSCTNMFNSLHVHGHANDLCLSWIHWHARISLYGKCLLCRTHNGVYIEMYLVWTIFFI